jgi:hypothetical protein
MVTISKFFTKTVITGSSPSNPGNVTTDIPPVVNPPVTVGSFLNLSDTPNSYSGQGGKTVAVKADASGLEFVAGGGGGSKWTDVGTDIYRNSAVSIGRTTIPSSSTFAVQSLTGTSGDKFFQLLNNAGSELLTLTQNSELTFAGNINLIANATNLLFPAGATTGSCVFRFNSQLTANSFIIQKAGVTYFGDTTNGLESSKDLYFRTIWAGGSFTIGLNKTDGTIYHERSKEFKSSVRRDELAHNYIQTIATAGTINNLSLSSQTKLIRITAASDLTGVIGENRIGTVAQKLLIYAAGVSPIIRNNSGSSSVNNRFQIGSDLTINNGFYQEFLFIDNGWRIPI